MWDFLQKMSELFFSEMKICILQLLKVFAFIYLFIYFANLTFKSCGGNSDFSGDFIKNVSTCLNLE